MTNINNMQQEYNNKAVDAVWNRHYNNKKYNMYIKTHVLSARKSGNPYSFSLKGDWHNWPPPLMPTPSGRYRSKATYAVSWASKIIQKYVRKMLRRNFAYTRRLVINELKTGINKRGILNDLNQNLKILITMRMLFKFLPTNIIDKIVTSI